MNKELNEDMRTKQDLLFECSSLGNRLSDEIIKNENLKQQVKKQKEVLDKAIEYINKNVYSYYDSKGEKYIEETVFERKANPKKLLDILKEVSE